MSTGYVHSIEVGSFVDGPGTRFVVFLSGCPLRCQYCHNPDCWATPGDATDSEDVVRRMARTAGFLKAGGGGVTISGGEPLAQADFALELMRGAKALGLHTALDTSGYFEERVTDEFLDNTDLVLLDIKSYDPTTYRAVTGVDVAPTLRLAERLSTRCVRVWIRFVLVPGLTDDPANISGLARFVAGLENVERVDVVPFHQMGRHKWEDLGIPYRLEDTGLPTVEDMRSARELFAAAGVVTGVTVSARCGHRSKEA